MQGLTEGWRGYPIWAEWRLFGASRPSDTSRWPSATGAPWGMAWVAVCLGEARPPGLLLGKRSHALLRRCAATRW